MTHHQQQQVTPPAKRIDFTQLIHDDERVDHYHWLRNKDTDTDVLDYIKNENEYTENHFIQPTQSLQTELYNEFLSRIKETDESVPFKSDNYMYYNRTVKDKQYAIYCRKEILSVSDVDGTKQLDQEQVLLDLNVIAEKEKYDFLSIGTFSVSPNHQILAYSLDTEGDEVYTLYFKNLTSNNLLNDVVEEISEDVEWASDNSTIFYTRMDDSMRSYKIFRHEVNFEERDEEETDHDKEEEQEEEVEEEGEEENEIEEEEGEVEEKDTLIYTELDEKFNVGLSRSSSDTYLFFSSASHTTTEVKYLLADDPQGEPKLLFERQQDVEYDMDHHGDYFYIIETSKGAKNGRLIRTPVNNPSWENSEVLIEHDEKVSLEGIITFKKFIAVFIRENGVTQVLILDPVTFEKSYIKFPDASYSLSDGDNDEYDSDCIRLCYTSFVTPYTIYDYHVNTKQLEQLKEYEVFNYDPSLYQTELTYAKSSVDGAQIPISLVYKKNVFIKNGEAPCLLNGYGGYSVAYDPHFDSTAVSLLDRGFVIGIAHIRGGGEYGKAWHESGKLLSKKNTFSDFIDCSEHLINNGYTSSKRLAIRGGSAGGLLIGNVVNARPDLFAVAINEVGFVDVTNSMLDSTLPLTIGEYEEIGNPSDSKQYYDYIRSYSPYDNLIAEQNVQLKYPAIFMTSGLNDPRVAYFESVKYVAKLRWYYENVHSKQHGPHVLYLKTNLSEGHSGKSGRYESLKEEAIVIAFLLSHIN
jgi:oligopeptidase B